MKASTTTTRRDRTVCGTWQSEPTEDGRFTAYVLRMDGAPLTPEQIERANVLARRYGRARRTPAHTPSVRTYSCPTSADAALFAYAVTTAPVSGEYTAIREAIAAGFLILPTDGHGPRVTRCGYRRGKPKMVLRFDPEMPVLERSAQILRIVRAYKRRGK